MPRASWTEIANRATEFAKEWEGETYEKGESQSFWTDFLDVFGIHRRRAGGYFEYAVKLRAGSRSRGFIDMFLPGKLLAEQKSAGRDLGAAQTQALEYLAGLDDHDLPPAVVTSDFRSFQHLNLDTREVTEFPLADLHKHVRLFGPLVEQTSVAVEEQNPVSREAAERIARLHNALESSGYLGYKLELFLVRLVFCLFADDSRIFEPGAFQAYITDRTATDGTDLGPRLAKLFDTLATKPEERSAHLDPDLAAFPHINGGLFTDFPTMPDFEAGGRLALIQACKTDWSQVSPAIFGAMFQGVMDADERHDLGAHYTSEENILRVIKPLFLDDLYAEFEAATAASDRRHGGQSSPRRKALDALHDRIASLRFLDPACGAGNFLVIAYRELRRLEHRIITATMEADAVALVDLDWVLRVRPEQFAGIEIDESAALIAHTALWLTDHQMNLEASDRFSHRYTRIPLTDGANIRRGNALEVDWSDVVPYDELDYIMGNPPFLGSRTMDTGQKAELRKVAKGFNQAGFLDYVAGWYIIANRAMNENPAIRCAFVSTNSISQGEQPGILWPTLLDQGCHITFAHRTFRWTNAAAGIAAVHCVIIGFARTAPRLRQLFDYPDIGGEPVLTLVPSISPYLVAGDEYVVGNRNHQIDDAPMMAFGNMPADGGGLILSAVERAEMVQRWPESEPWIRPLIGAKEFLQGGHRYCLWLVGAGVDVIAIPGIKERVAAVRATRLNSARPELADSPHLFAQRTVSPDKPFLVVPRVSSENREYVPMGYFEQGSVVADSCLAVPDAPRWLFSLLTSRMHMDWLRLVGGRLKSDVRYSKDVVYNNFVLPKLADGQREQLTVLADAILAARAANPTGKLANLYDPVTMPAEVRAAHRANDAYVDSLYSVTPFLTADARVRHLLDLHRSRTAAH